MIVLVTGTDTNVGKTYVTCSLVRWLRARGTDAIALKPVETGWNEAGSDAQALATASGRSIDQTLWQHFGLAAAPSVAAVAEGRSLDPTELANWITASARGTTVCFVEGAGGWLVPFGREWMLGDLANRVADTLGVLVVARASLGTINHSLLTVESIERTARVVAVALSRLPAVDPQVAHSNRSEIQQRIGAPVHVVPEELDALGTQFHVELTRRGT